jgi:alpha-glucosidase
MQNCYFMPARQIILCFLLVLAGPIFAQKVFNLSSPSGNVSVSVQAGDTLTYAISLAGKKLITESPIAMLTSAGNFGISSHITGSSTRQVRETIVNPVPYKRKNVADHFNELTVRFREKFAVIFRAYDDGAAYRFSSFVKDSLQINDELSTFRYQESDSVFFPQIQKRDSLDIFHTSFEELYRQCRMNEIKQEDMAFTPVLVNGLTKTIITESDLSDYPGMFLRGTGQSELRGSFAPYPEREKIFGGEFKQRMVVKRKNFLARTRGTRSFPWRVIIISQTDKGLLMNDLVYRLGSPAEGDWSWVKGGISTEEWICGINLHGVDFKAGLNTASYKYYIDFASSMGMQYVMLDAGWSDVNDLFSIAPGMDLAEISAYSKSKNIGLIYWTLSMTLERQLENAIDMLSKLNAKVLMTDFMDRDDQKIVNFYHRVAKAAAAKHLMVMFHGAYKNAGLERTYPNAITREGVLGSEFNIWSSKVTPDHDLILPFTRMVTGPMDYEPGFMVNVNKQTFQPLPDVAMSMGTRCHQLAMFVAYESPLQLFSGNPSDALEEPAYTKYLASLPTTWDETVALEGKIGDYMVVARKKNKDWYLAAMTDWSARSFDIDLSFLEEGNFRVEICEDGINAQKYGSDYRMRVEMVSPSEKLKIKMAPGGGYVAKLIKVE